MTSSYNNFAGKLALAQIRGNEFAHPGELEAINFVLSKLPNKTYQSILDIGCGLGKTLDIIHNQLNPSQSLGIDIDQESINYCTTKFPHLKFIQANVLRLQDIIDTKYKLIYMFNVLYCIDDQEKLLKDISQSLANDGVLVIFDYIDKRVDKQIRFKNEFAKSANFKPLDNRIINSITQGYKTVDYYLLDFEYEKWYIDLLEKLRHNQNQIIHKFGFDFYTNFYQKYQDMLQDIIDNNLGGGVWIISK